jgi:hypothetical protein
MPQKAKNIIPATRLVLLALLCMLLSLPPSFQGRPAAAAPPLLAPAVQPGVVSVPVKIYFSRFPQSLNNFSAVFPVARTAPTPDVATFAIQLLIAGPTVIERHAGYFSEINSLLSGPSACSAPYPTGGPDFTLDLNRQGSTVAVGTATLKFCRTATSPGIGADARVRVEITATLRQFTSIKNVVVLTKSGHCFGDESGLDRCLR